MIFNILIETSWCLEALPYTSSMVSTEVICTSQDGDREYSIQSRVKTQKESKTTKGRINEISKRPPVIIIWNTPQLDGRISLVQGLGERLKLTCHKQ